MSEAVELTLAPKPEYVLAVRHVLGALARMVELSPDSVEDLKLAVSEAVTNAVTRVGRAGSTEPVRVRALPENGAVTIEVADAGPGFDPEALAGGDGEPDSLEFSFEAGLSLPVVRGLVEDLDIVSPPEGGMVVRFTVRR